MTTVLIDGDIVAMRCAFSAETEPVYVAYSRADEMLDGILEACEATAYEIWLSGKSNFRYKVYPEYKSNRINMKRPKWEQEIKTHLINEWGAKISENCEADDMLGVRAMELNNNDHM